MAKKRRNKAYSDGGVSKARRIIGIYLGNVLNRHYTQIKTRDLVQTLSQNSNVINFSDWRAASKKERRRMFVEAAANLPNAPKAASGVSDAEARAFYSSFAWRRVRYEALRNNNGRCELCGRSKHDGAVLHVDHIKPLKIYWSRRLKESNLQVLCSACNHGKGSKYEDDWREPRLSVLMGERID